MNGIKHSLNSLEEKKNMAKAIAHFGEDND